MKRQSINVVICVLGACLCCATAASLLAAQEKDVSWDEALKGMESRQASVKGFKANFRLSINYRPKNSNNKDQGAETPKTLNRAYSIFWATKGPMWRSEIAELYPSEPGQESILYYAGYNGERYHCYDERRGLGIISPDEDHLRTGLYLALQSSAPDANLLGLNFPLDYIHQLKERKLDFKFSGRERVNNFNCLRYVARNQGTYGPFRITLWLSQEKGYTPIKFMDEEFVNQGEKIATGSIQIFSVQELALINPELYIPKVAKKEYYQFNNKKRTLLSSITFVLDEFNIDRNIPSDFFNPHFVPSISVLDMIENPDQLKTVGGQFSDVVSMAKRIEPPVQELPEGAALPEKID